MIRQSRLLTVLMIISVHGLKSQYYFYNDKYYNSTVLIETGLAGGGYNCLTDLGGGKGYGKPFIKDINWKNTHPGGGIYFTILFDQILGLRAEASFGKISAADNVLKNDQSVAANRYSRNLQFQSIINEVSLLGEFFPLSLLSQESYPLLTPYLMAGVGLFKFNPIAQINGQSIHLHPLHTEGQGFKEYPDKQPYKLIQMNFPIGAGLRYEISALFTARLEILYRFLKTDYLDDVSTQYINSVHFYSNLPARDAIKALSLADRSGELHPGNFKHEGEIRGNPRNKDAYFSLNFKLGFILNRKRR